MFSDWLYKWKCFVSNKVSSSAGDDHAKMSLRRSENDKVGILPPGPISNDTLFEKLGKNSETSKDPKLKRGLVLN